MRYLTLLLLACSLKSFSLEKTNCLDAADLFTFSREPLNKQAHAEDNFLFSVEINKLLITGLKNFYDNKFETGYRSFEEALRMMRGNYGLYSSTQIKALAPMIKQTLIQKDFLRFYKYQNIFNNLILRLVLHVSVHG